MDANVNENIELNSNKSNTFINKIGKVKIISNDRIRNPNYCILILTCLMIIIPSLIYSILIIPLYSAGEMAIIYIVLFICLSFCFYSLYDVNTYNPGLIPSGNFSKEEFFKINNKIEVNGCTIELKHCNTCKIIRPPRSFHCDLCGCCVSIHDHHCPFVGNCVGENNIGKFFIFIISVLILCIKIFIVCILSFMKELENKKRTDYTLVVSIIMCTITALFGLGMIFMILQQVYFISFGLTTNEFIRKKSDKKLFDEGCCNNWRRAFNCKRTTNKYLEESIVKINLLMKKHEEDNGIV